jgi:hypothetical protein
LDRFRKLLARIGIPAYIGLIKHDGWRKPLPHYLIYCSKHGYSITYPMGYEERIECEKCQKRMVEKEN